MGMHAKTFVISKSPFTSVLVLFPWQLNVQEMFTPKNRWLILRHEKHLHEIVHVLFVLFIGGEKT